MVKIGMTIADRYEILEKIGTGGMADVYKAVDNKLSRNVAVKVLKQEFSENENFVSKFRVEAQAAAGLMHPNVVNVYDVGEEGGIYYIVMELVEGITLKKYIEKKARLSFEEAVSIAIQVGMGIEAAHEKHIIHRDIKPQNIIISLAGKVKVTDFGIAKAATSNTITSNVMGSVHYTSPEQARGGYSDEKSDIYSLGITMFEMLTGRVPFNGETTVAIAIKHIQESMPSPRDYVPEIPNSLEDIVLKCCEKSPDRRYQNMQELVEDLKQCLMTPEADFVVRRGVENDGTRAVTAEEMDEIRKQTGGNYIDPDYPDDYGYGEGEDYPDDGYDEGEDYPDDGGYDPDYDHPEYGDHMRLARNEKKGRRSSDYDGPSSMEKVTTVLSILAGIIIVFIIIFLAIKIIGKRMQSTDTPDTPSTIVIDDTTHTTSEVVEVTMPTVVGSDLENAREALLLLGLNPLVDFQESETIPSGTVMSCDIEPGTKVISGTNVNLLVSSGTDSVEMPDVVDKPVSEATSMLILKGFIVNTVEANSDEVPAGYVISQNPEAGVMAANGVSVTITVSVGATDIKVVVPGIVGMDETDATITCIENQLSIGHITYVTSDQYEAGVVVSQSLAENSSVGVGTVIDFEVSSGPVKHTYKCNLSVSAPSASEAPDYIGGTEVRMRLVGSDGKVLLDQTTREFPYTANFYGIGCPSGVLTITYTVIGEPVIDENGNSTPGTPIERSFTREIIFTQEDD
ncbi:MAG: Stk1 family PASTA domain-containing Ser/Thr kinase [Lachnospiraceae bacterium]|nr:Stk1 family PASTA domain-containing Ser/Thr kinase [Lachnospiraceae bacterium]